MSYKKGRGLKNGAEELRQSLSTKRKNSTFKLDSEYVNVQLLSAEPSGITQKYKRIGALESVGLSQKKRNLSLIKEACIKHFQIGNDKKCDLLVSERGPSVREINQLNLDKKKLIHCRFVDIDVDVDKKMEEDDTSKAKACSKLPPSKSKEPTSNLSFLSSKLPAKSVPASVSLSAYLSAGQIVASKKKIVALVLEEYNVDKVEWMDPFSAKFIVDTEEFARGGFRKVFKAKCISGDIERGSYVLKQYLEEKIEDITHLVGESITTQTRKNVQMHMVARHLAKSMAKEVPDEFGDIFWYEKIFFSEFMGESVAIEKFVDGPFEKYVNNNGTFEVDDTSVLMLKAQAFMHYTFVKSKDMLMVTDIQGFGHQLTDPEIASSEMRGKDNKWNFCSGNCSHIAINTFFENHNCNKYCTMLKL